MNKLVICLLSACVVAVGGVYLYTSSKSDCKGGCPLSAMLSSCSNKSESCSDSEPCSISAKPSCCSQGESAACSMKVANCCEDSTEVASKDPMAAGLGGVTAFGVK